MNPVSTRPFFLLLLMLLFVGGIEAQPGAEFSATPVSGCAPLLVQFKDLSTGSPITWKWDLGNGTASNKNPSTTYFNPGKYKITLTVTNANGSNSITKDGYITVLPNPVVNFSGTPVSGCVPLTVKFADLSTPGTGALSTWKWDFGDGSGAAVQNPQHTYTSPGTFDVTLQVKNNFGCGGVATKPKIINTGNSVSANFSNNLQLNCKPPVTLNFLNQSTGPPSLKYQWNFGDNTTSNNTNPQHTYTKPGNYIVRLIAESNGGECSGTIQKTITIGTVDADFSSANAVCMGTPFLLTNKSSPAPGKVVWDFGDGTTADSINPVKIYNTPGNYTIKMVADFGACRDSISRTIDVLSRQSVVFSTEDTAACKAPFTVNFTSNVPGATAYNWDFGDGSTSTSANPVHTYTVAGFFDVSLFVTNSSGCRDTAKKIKYIKIQAPVITLPYLPLKNCVPFTYTFTSTISSPVPVAKYTWDFGDGTTDTAKTPTHTFGVAGSYPIALTITTISGCTATTRVLNGVAAGNKPVANFRAAPLSSCANTPISFTDLSTGAVNEWRWDFGDRDFSTSRNPAHVYNDTGFFKVKLTVRSNGCPDSVTFTNYIYIKPAVAKFTIKSSCTTPLQKTFIDSSKGADAWEWNFGDLSTSTLRNPPIHVYPDTGNYTVTLKVTNNSTGCIDTSTRLVQVIREKAAFTANNPALCKGISMYFKSQNNLSKLINLNWSFGDGTPTQNVRDSVSHTYANAGVFSVALILTDLLGCNDTLVKPQYITVFGPKAKFGSLQNSCSNTVVNFEDSSVTDGIHPITRWLWDYGDSATQLLNAPPFMHSYTKQGTYSIKLKVTDSNGCTDSVTKKNYLAISKPVAQFTTEDTSTCPLAPVQFSTVSQGVNLNYLWDFGDGTTASSAAPVHQFTAAGNYTVSLKITDQSGCSDSLKKLNYIAVRLPRANFTLDDSVSACPPFLVSFTNTSANYTALLWDFGDGNFSSSPDPTHFYNTPGTFVVSLRVTAPGGCADEKFSTIVIKGPKGILSYTNLEGCNQLETNFKASATDNVSFTWDFNDGTTVKTSDSSISHIYTEAGFYLPKLILEDANGCQVPISGIDTIKVITIQANFVASAKKACDAGNITLFDSAATNGIVNTWVWDFGDGNTSVQQNPVHYYTSPGSYTISLIETTENGCTDTATKNGYINIVARPDIGIGSRTTACLFDTLTFNGIFLRPDTSIVTWTWNFKNGNTSSLQNPLPQTYSQAGSYTVTAIAINSSGCNDTAYKTVGITPLPPVNAGRDTFLCLGSGVRLQASGASVYEWILPADFLSCTNCANPVTNTPGDISYTVKGTGISGCVAFDSVNIMVKRPFTLKVTPASDSICAGESVQLNVSSAAENFLWTPASGLNNSIAKNPVASPASDITYKVIAYDSGNCFKDSAFVSIRVFKYPLVEAGPGITVKAGVGAVLSPVYSNDVTNWLWTPGTGLNCSNCPAPLAKPNTTTTYTIKVVNAAGCSAADKVTIFTTCNSENIFIPNTFSPNGDGVNDIFYPRGTGLNRIRGMKIFNRWGQTVFEKSNFYANDPSSGWNGSVGGKKVPADVFTFVIDIICDNNDLVVQQGTITLIK